ncbi:MAG TPA: tRNA pseudouridine(55) synthase TruB [Zeimonas sp.]
MNIRTTPLRDRIDGVLLLDKPLGLSSNDALVRARRLLGARKVGHGGTLDPLASGLLPLLFGEATKFALDSLDADKTYLAELMLGVTTESGDAEGRVLAEREPVHDEARLRQALSHFVGEIEQVPPMHSALKHGGRPLYEYARAGVVVERAARRITIRSIELLRFAPPRAWLRVTCSKGTYVRSLAIDLGERLGCGAHLSGLRRERVGTLDVADAVTLDALDALGMSGRRARLLPVDALLGGLPRVDLDAPLAARFLQGQKLRIALSGPGAPPDAERPPDAGAPALRVRVYDAGKLLGVALHESGELQPQRLVATDSPGRDAGPGKLR